MFPPQVHPSLESVSPTSRIRQLIPEDIYPGGAYVNLPMGRVRYWLFGPENGAKVVLIHGLSIPAIAWKDVAPALAENGFRVLAYDLYGKGYSEAPQTMYDTGLFITQLALLMQYVHWEKARIVGFSMGGGIAATFAATLPHLVQDKVVIISSAGLIGERRDGATDQTSTSNVVSGRNPSAIMLEVRQLQIDSLPGYESAMASCISDGPISGLRYAFEILGNAEPRLNVLIIHGTADDTVPYEDAVSIHNCIPHAELVTLEGAGHDMIVQAPFNEKVVASLLQFLK